MKRLMSLCLMVILVLSLAACNFMPNANSTHSDEENVSLSVLCVNTDYSRNFIRTIQTHFPDVKLEVEYYAAPNNPSEYVERLIESGNAPDIVYTGALLKEGMQKEYLLDLSVYDFAGQYSVSIMNQRDIDGALYMLPGTYSVFSMLYNKSLFEEKGWKVPATNDEFIALCWQIREGEASFETGFGDALRMMQEWKDVGVLDASDGNTGINDMYMKLMNREAVRIRLELSPSWVRIRTANC